MDGMPPDELSDCCKLVEQVKDRQIASAVAAAQQAAEVEFEKYEARVYELEKLAFDKAKLVSGLEGEIAGLKRQLEIASTDMTDVHVKMPPLKTTPVVAVIQHPSATAEAPVEPLDRRCVVCKCNCISLCPECKAPVCIRWSCGKAHGHGEMYKS